MPEVLCVILVLSRWGQEDQELRVILSWVDLRPAWVTWDLDVEESAETKLMPLGARQRQGLILPL